MIPEIKAAIPNTIANHINFTTQGFGVKQKSLMDITNEKISSAMQDSPKHRHATKYSNRPIKHTTHIQEL
jgi:hypothetical protein